MRGSPVAPALVIIADDLSGAAETAGAVAAASGARARLWLGHPGGFDEPVVAIDTGARALPTREAGSALNATLDGIPTGARIYKKVDSLLRGNLAVEMGVLRARGLPAVVAMAVPRIGRTVLDGVVHVASTPLHSSALWGAEAGSPPSSIAEAIGVPSAVLTLDIVRSASLAEAIGSAVAAGLVPVCDSESEADLELVAAALGGLDPRIVVVGAAGLARPLAVRLSLVANEPRFVPAARRIVTVVGSLVPSTRAQVVALIGEGVTAVELRPGVSPRLEGGDAVVTLSAEWSWDAAALAGAFAALARAIVALEGRTDLVLTGGDTARRTLDALGVTSIFPEHEIHDGAVLSTTDAGLGIVTRPGSYGSDDSLLQIIRHLKGHPSI